MPHNYIYSPAVGSERGLGETFPIDAHAPRGIFETNRGDIYLVCDGPIARFAVVLKHRLHHEFREMRLGAQALDHGTWLGVGKFCVVSEVDEETGDAGGNLLILEDIIQMWVRREDGLRSKPLVANGAWYADFPLRVDVWALIVGDRIVFQHDGTGTLFDEELTRKVKALL